MKYEPHACQQYAIDSIKTRANCTQEETDMKNTAEFSGAIPAVTPAQKLFADYRQAAKAIPHLEYRLRNLEDLATDISAHLSPLPRSDSPDQQRLESILVARQETEEALVLARQSTNKLRAKLLSFIAGISDPLVQQILKLHYVELQSVHSISNSLHVCDTYVYIHQRKGIAELDTLLAKEAPEGLTRPASVK